MTKKSHLGLQFSIIKSCCAVLFRLVFLQHYYIAKGNTWICILQQLNRREKKRIDPCSKLVLLCSYSFSPVGGAAVSCSFQASLNIEIHSIKPTPWSASYTVTFTYLLTTQHTGCTNYHLRRCLAFGVTTTHANSDHTTAISKFRILPTDTSPVWLMGLWIIKSDLPMAARPHRLLIHGGLFEKPAASLDYAGPSGIHLRCI